MIPGRRPTFSDSGGMAVPPFESQVCRPTVTLGRPQWDRFMPVPGRVSATGTGSANLNGRRLGLRLRFDSQA